MAHKIVFMKLDDITSAELNPKRHDIPALAKSVARFGFVAPAVLNQTTGRLVAGHGRIEALRKLKTDGAPAPKGVQVKGDAWLAPVICGIEFTEEEAAAYVLADNRLSEIGGWDFPELDKLLKDVAKTDIDLGAIGYTLGDLRAIEVEALVGIVPRYTDQDAKPPPTEPGGLVDDGAAAPGEAPKGPSTAMGADVNSQIRRVMLYVTTEQYNRILDLLSKVMEKTGTKNHSEAVLKVLEDAYGSAA